MFASKCLMHNIPYIINSTPICILNTKFIDSNTPAVYELTEMTLISLEHLMH